MLQDVFFSHFKDDEIKGQVTDLIPQIHEALAGTCLVPLGINTTL